MQTFVVKLASGVAALVASICLEVCKISKDTSDGAALKPLSDSSALGLRMTMTILPIIGLVAAIIVFRKKYILTDKKLEEINEELRAKHN